MTSENSQNRVAWPVAFGEYPVKGSRSMPQTLDFSAENPVNINLTFEQESKRLEFVQALYLDNSANPATLSVSMKGTGQSISIPAGWQGYVPVLATADNCRISFSTAGTPLVPVQFLSFPVPLALWPSSAGANSFINGGSTGLDYSVNKPALAANLLATVPVNPARADIEVQNQSADPIQVVMDDGAGGNISVLLLAPGSGANSQGGDWQSDTFKGRVRVYGPNAGDQVFVHQN